MWSVADTGSEERGGARGFGGLPPRFFGYILANLEDFLKYLAKIACLLRHPHPPPPPLRPGSATGACGKLRLFGIHIIYCNISAMLSLNPLTAGAAYIQVFIFY